MLFSCPRAKWIRLAAGVALAVVPVLAGPGQPLKAGYHEAPPYVRLSGGKVSGVAFDVFDAAARRAGVEIEWVPSATGPDQALTTGAVDLYPLVAITPERRRLFHITDRWLETHFCLLATQSSGIDSRTAMKGRQIAYSKSSAARMLVARTVPDAAGKEYSSPIDAIVHACRGEADAAFAEARLVESLLLDRPEGCRGIPLNVIPLPEASVDLGVGATKARTEAADRIHAAIVELGRDGTIEKIFSRWKVTSGKAALDKHIAAEDSALRIRWIFASLVMVILILLLQYLRIRDAKRSADSANSAKGEFLANMSHEIRTPLNGVMGLAAALSDAQLPPQQKQLVRDLSDCSEALLGVINDILDFSRMEAGQLAIEYAVFDLHAAVRSAVTTQSARATQKGLTVRLEISDQVPRWVDGDELRIRQVLVNLVGNAVKFTQKGGFVVSVTRDQSSDIEFSVSDTGIGIDEAGIEKLFSAFTQADSSMTRKYGGTGLGLAICKHLTALMGGTIGVESRPGSGSRFWFRIPLELAAGPAVPPALAAAEAPAAEEPVPAEPAVILVAEDNAVNRKVVDHILRKFGFRVECAVNGLEALQAVQKKHYDLILMDCQMPEMDGYRATGEIRILESQHKIRRTPIVALTAHAMIGDREKCLEAGMDDYLTKPVQKQLLLQTLMHWIPEPSIPQAARESISAPVPVRVPEPVLETSTHTS